MKRRRRLIALAVLIPGAGLLFYRSENVPAHRFLSNCHRIGSYTNQHWTYERYQSDLVYSDVMMAADRELYEQGWIWRGRGELGFWDTPIISNSYCFAPRGYPLASAPFAISIAPSRVFDGNAMIMVRRPATLSDRFSQWMRRLIPEPVGRTKGP